MLSSPAADSPDSAQRRDRAVVAAQACETCRNRKSRCDEQRPRCSLCRRLGVECVYREPLPTKKDKTMVQVLDTLTRLETKFDSMVASGTLTSSSTPSLATMSSNTRLTRGSVSQSSSSANPTIKSGPLEKYFEDLQQGADRLTVPHKTLLWPAIYVLIVNSGSAAAKDLQHVLQSGTPWFIEKVIEKDKEELATNFGLNSFAVLGDTLGSGQHTTVGFPSLDVQHVRECCDAYFYTFNIVHPILDRDAFMNGIMKPIVQGGFAEGDIGTVIALLVLALGEAAIAGISGDPISTVENVASGFRGGTFDHPPGLQFFNEARRRIGFIATVISLENVQVHLLQATYYGTCARHMDYWRSTTIASMAVQVLVQCRIHDFRSPYGDLVKRAYWTCVLSEDLYHLDLDLPPTNVQNLEDKVPLPYAQDYNEALNTESWAAADQSHFPHHFLSMIALRGVITRINSSVYESKIPPLSEEPFAGPHLRVVQELAHQLEAWRTHLPLPLQWTDQARMNFPSAQTPGRRPSEQLFSATSSAVPVMHQSNLDIVAAQLRTRFYFAKYMLYRPFIYKAIHHAESMTAEDRLYCAQGLKAALLWPMSLAPPKDKKRLVPHLFTWTSNFVSILLVLRLTREEGCLKEICEEQVSAEDINKSIVLMLEWIRDMSQCDAIAEWGWNLLQSHYF